MNDAQVPGVTGSDGSSTMQEKPRSRFRIVPRAKSNIIHQGEHMRAPYGLEIVESCLNCPYRQERLFCDLSNGALQRLNQITSASTQPKGALLFVEGQPPRGVYILCSGRVKLSTSSADGRTLIVRMSEPGEVLGLPSTVTGKPYELTAEVIEPTQVNFISRADFVDFLRQHGEAALRVAEQLSETYHSAISEMRTIGLSHSASQKLARFLLDWCSTRCNGKDESRGQMTLTHEEIAQVIGASRETVTRLFGDFKKRKWLLMKGSSLTILDKAALQSLARS
jgi:CRP/FNR family cyclic AMP-dependent transcriptional regulator